MKAKPMDKITTREAAKRLGVSHSYMRWMIMRGLLKAEQRGTGHENFIAVDDLDAFAASWTRKRAQRNKGTTQQ